MKRIGPMTPPAGAIRGSRSSRKACVSLRSGYAGEPAQSAAPASRDGRAPAVSHAATPRRGPHPGERMARAHSRAPLSPGDLTLGNGSTEVLLGLFLVFGGPGRRTLLFQPTYSMHARLSVIAGGEAQ